MPRYTVLVLLAALLLAGGCRGSAGELELEADDNGRQVELEKGQALVISLESNPTTGYRWEVAELDESVLRQQGDAEFRAESDLLGAGGVEILRFEGVNAGQTALKLVYHRSWEKGVEPLETFSIDVVVH